MDSNKTLLLKSQCFTLKHELSEKPIMIIFYQRKNCETNRKTGRGVKDMSKSVSSDEFWAYLQREYFYRFPKATHDEAMAFLMRFTEVSKNSTKEGATIIEELFEEERQRRERR
uniref:Pd113 protein n=4 Tax=Enterococcus faecalis TaxID=1351 RepID=Q47769_ENTFL|nr:pd113 [Enterococcus faecalis] [Enterococcus faecalis OG1X]